MKTTLCILIVVGLAGFSHAAKTKKTGKADKQALHAAVIALKAFDKNANKTIDGEELVAVQKSFAEAPSGALAVLDKNKDGKLDDAEIKAVNARGAFTEIVKEIDKDKNHKIEGTEVEALKKKVEADPKSFGRLDHNGNGKLDDDELAKLNERIAERAASAGKGKGKKKAPASPPVTPAKPEEAKPATKGEEVKKPDTTKA